jgi:hypothetical protein
MGEIMSKAENAEPGGMSRRTVVRTGVTAAWTAPAITVLAASPAFATASGPATLVMSGPTTAAHPPKDTVVTVSSGVRNGGGQPAGSLQATVSLTGNGKSGWGSATSATIAGQWVLSSTNGSGDQVTFVFTAIPTDLAGGATKPFTPTITLPANGKMASGTVTVTFTAIAAGGGSATSGPVPVP